MATMNYDDPIQADAAALSAIPLIYDSRAFLENAEWLRRLARGLVGDEGVAEDLVHDAFQSFASAKRSVRNPRAYLAATVRFLSLKGKRAAGRRTYHEQARSLEQRSVAPATDDVNERMEVAQVALDEMRSLPPAQSRALGLRYVDGLSPAEIAHRDGTTASSVRGLISRGLASLRERMDSRFGERSAWSAVLLPWAVAPLPEAATMALADSAARSSADQFAGHSTVLTSTAAKSSLALVLKVCLVAVPCILFATWLGSRSSGAMGSTGDVSPKSTGLVRKEAPTVAAQPDLGSTLASARSVLPQRSVTGSSEGETSPMVAQATAELRGRLVDAATKEPIPGIELRVSLEDATESAGSPSPVQTDSAGQFQAPGVRLPSGKMRVQAMDQDSFLSMVESSVAFPFQQDLEARIGPTFRFLYSGANVDRELALDVFPSESALGFTKIGLARTRPGPLPWVRFDSPLSPDVNELLLTSPDGFTFGRAAISRQVGIEPEPIRVAFQRGGIVSFTAGAAALSGTHVVEVIPAGGGPEKGRVLRLHRQRDEGTASARFTHLAAGDYAWTIHAGQTTRTGEVTVAPMQVTEVQLDTLQIDAASVEIVIDATEFPDLDLGTWESLLLFESDPTQGTQSKLSRLAAGAPGTWHLTVPNLPVGRWIYGLRPKPGYEVDPPLCPVEAGMPMPTIVVRRAPEQVEVQITVVDAETQQGLPTALGFHMDGFKGTQLGTPSEGTFPAFGIHPSRTSLFLLHADGYRVKDIEFDPEHDEPVMIVALERGWRNRILAADMATQSFLPDVSVHVDGKHVGATGPDGALWLEGDGPPEKVEVALFNPELKVTLSPFEQVGIRLADSPVGFIFMVRSN